MAVVDDGGPAFPRPASEGWEVSPSSSLDLRASLFSEECPCCKGRKVSAQTLCKGCGMIPSIRCSKLPLAMLCPASQQPGDYPTTSDGDAARLGTAVHEYLARRIGREPVADDLAGVLAVKYGVDRGDVNALAWKAWRLWEEVEKWFPAPQVETPLGATYATEDASLVLTGTLDVLSYDAERKTVFVGDHKTGFLDSDHADQVKGYGYLALKQFPDAERVHTVLLRVRDYVCDHAGYTRAELGAWFERVVGRLTAEAGSYNPGRHCAHCPRWSSCPAYRDHLRGAVDALEEIASVMGSPVPPLQAYDSIKLLEKLCENARDALKSQAQQNGGAVSLDDDYELRLAGQVRQAIRFGPALLTLRKHLSNEEISSAVSVSKGKVQELVKAKAGRGEKGAAVAGLMQELDEAGALEETVIERLELKRKDKPQLTGATT